MAIGIGTVLALCVILLLYLVRKNPAKAKKILERTCTLLQRAHTHACTQRTHTHRRGCMHTRMHAQTHAHTRMSTQNHFLKVSFLSVEVLLALKTFFAGLDFYTESAARANLSVTTMSCYASQSQSMEPHLEPRSLVPTYSLSRF